jgi:riboflavin kinase / FMN adenylyltransferase
MHVHRKPDDLPSFQNSVITIGTFDGVHKGHQQLIERIVNLAKNTNGESVLITFDPHPRQVIHPEDKSLRILTTLDEKIDLLNKFSIDHLVIVPFTKQFSQLNAREYIHSFLFEKFQPSTIVIGYNHEFGHHRDGNIELLRKVATEYSFTVEEIPKQLVDEIAVSSTRIRIALQEGDLDTAFHLLGRFYSLEGSVIKGEALGRTLGFPTANISVENPFKMIPSRGIYAVIVEVLTKKYNGMLSIGTRPTVNGKNETIEVNIFDFDKNIYDEKISVSFAKRLRDEKKFNNLEELKTAMKEDKINSLKTLSRAI